MAAVASQSIHSIEERHPKEKLHHSPAKAFSILKGMLMGSPVGIVGINSTNILYFRLHTKNIFALSYQPFVSCH